MDPKEKGKGRGKNSKVQETPSNDEDELERQELEAEIQLLDQVDHETELEELLEDTEITSELQSSSKERDACPIMVRKYTSLLLLLENRLD